MIGIFFIFLEIRFNRLKINFSDQSHQKKYANRHAYGNKSSSFPRKGGINFSSPYGDQKISMPIHGNPFINFEFVRMVNV